MRYLVSQVRLVLILILKMGRESKSADKRVSIFDTCESKARRVVDELSCRLRGAF